jgi:NAD(P)-dependent dehydrogenase (short-subunit alcohol dehydrogenase family)
MGQYLVDSYASGVIPKEMIPVSRVGDVKDMAGAILFLASRAGAYVNGNILLTDGGALSTLPASY